MFPLENNKSVFRWDSGSIKDLQLSRKSSHCAEVIEEVRLFPCQLSEKLFLVFLISLRIRRAK